MGQGFDLVAMHHRVRHESGDVTQIGLTHGLQLQLWDVELVLDAVLDTHGHQRVEPQFDQRDLPREILGLVTHRLGDDHRDPAVDALAALGIPSRADVVADLRLDGQVRVDESGCRGGRGRCRCRDRLPVGGSATEKTSGGDDRVEQQGERPVDGLGMDLQRRSTGMGGERRRDRSLRRHGPA